MRAKCNHCGDKLVMQSGGRPESDSLTRHYGKCKSCRTFKRVWVEVADTGKPQQEGDRSSKEKKSDA